LSIIETDNCPFEATLVKSDAWRVTNLNSTHNHLPRNFKKRNFNKQEIPEWTEKDLFKMPEI